MTSNITRRASIGASAALALILVSHAFADTPPPPDRSMLTSSTTLPVDSAQGMSLRSPSSQTVRRTGKAHALAGGSIVNLGDVPVAQKNALDEQRFHRQGSGTWNKSRPGQAPGSGDHSAAADPDSPEAASGGGAAAILIDIDAVDSTQSIWSPPDMHLAVGPQYAVEVVNSGFAVYAKTGHTARAYRTFASFLTDELPAGWGGYHFDPRVVFDPTLGKFVMLILGKDENQQVSGYWLAVSETDDPRGQWCIRGRDTSLYEDGTSVWLDFAALGTDPFGVYVTGNYLTYTESHLGGALHSFPASLMTGCGPVAGSVIYDIDWPGGIGIGFALQPAQAHTQNAAGETFFVNTFSGFADVVMFSRLSGNRANNPTLTSTTIEIPFYQGVYNNVEQPGSSWAIDGGNAWPRSAAYAHGSVYFSLTTLVEQTQFASGWLTVEIDTDTETVAWDHIHWLGEGRYLMYPALVYQGDEVDGHIALFGSDTDAETFLTLTTRYASGIMRMYDNRPFNGGPAATIEVGTSVYVNEDDDGRNRWGDYSGGAYDWTCGHAWGAVQSATGPTDWKTTIAAVEFDSEGGCPKLYVTEPVHNQPLLSGSTYHVRWSGQNLPPNDWIYVFYDTDDDLPVQIAGPLPPLQTGYFWQVPELADDTVRIIAGSYDGSDYSALAYSDPFTVVDTIAPTPDPLEWTNPPTATGTDSIAMSTSASDGSGGAVQFVFNFVTGGAGGAGRDWGPSPAYQNTGLEPNAEYCYRAAARDAAPNVGGYSALACNYTWARAPGLGGFTDVSAIGVTVLAQPAGNPPDTEYRFENLTTGTLSEWLDTPAWSNSGLLPGQIYGYRVQARNQNGIETDWTALGAVATLNDDADNDGVLAAMDNCLNVANPDQRDGDGDNIGNACDLDLSQDCVVNPVDLGMLKLRFFTTDETADFNGDGIVNAIDLGAMRAGFFGAVGPSGLPNACRVEN